MVARGIDQLICLPLYFPFIVYWWKLFFTDEDVFVSVYVFGLFVVIPVIYEISFLILMQATPGKVIMGLKVVPSADLGQKLDWQQCVLRPIVNSLSLLIGYAAYSLAFFKYDRTHFGDWMAETRVVQKTARTKTPKKRYILGCIFIVLSLSDGLSTARLFIGNVDWENRIIDLRKIVKVSEMPLFE